MRLVKSFHKIKDYAGSSAVKIACWLVREQDFWPGYERARERNALLLASGKLSGAMTGAVLKLHFREPSGGFFKCGGFCFPAGQQRHGDILHSGKLRQKIVKLPYIANFAIAEAGGLFA